MCNEKPKSLQPGKKNAILLMCTTWSGSGVARPNKSWAASKSSCMRGAIGKQMTDNSVMVWFGFGGILYLGMQSVAQSSWSAMCVQIFVMSFCVKSSKPCEMDSIIVHKKTPQSHPLSCNGVLINTVSFGLTKIKFDTYYIGVMMQGPCIEVILWDALSLCIPCQIFSHKLANQVDFSSYTWSQKNGHRPLGRLKIPNWDNNYHSKQCAYCSNTAHQVSSGSQVITLVICFWDGETRSVDVPVSRSWFGWLETY